MTDDITLIHSYTRREAVQDGVLVDATETARDAGFRYPVALTAAAWATCVTVPTSAPWQDEAGRLWDVLTMLGHAVRATGRDRSQIQFDVLVQNDRVAPKLVRLKAVCGPDDDRSPCITVMMPGED